MKLSRDTRLHQARLQVLRARDRLPRDVAGAMIELDAALSHLDVLVSAGPVAEPERAAE